MRMLIEWLFRIKPVIDTSYRPDMFDPLIKEHGKDLAYEVMYMYSETRGKRVYFHYKHKQTRAYITVRVN